MKKYLKEILVTISMILFTVACYYIRMTQSTETEINALLFELSKGNQIRQIICVLFLFILGLITLLNVKRSLSESWLVLLAYPVGFALWGAVSCIILCVGIRYNLLSMSVILLLIEIGLALMKTGEEKKEHKEFLIRSCIIIIGIVCVMSTGALYTFASHDSHYFIDILGRGIFLEGGLTENFKTYMLHTGIAPATINSLMCMLGGDTIYGVHHCLVLNFYIIFAYAVYKETLKYYKKKKAIIVAVMTVCAMASIPAIQLLSGWIISNTHIMIYSFLLIVIFKRIEQLNAIPADYKVILTILIVFMTFLRADAPIFMGCLFVCLSITQIRNRDIVLWCILPSACSVVIYYIVCCIVLKNNLNGVLLMPGTMSAMIGLYVVLLGWFCVIRNKRMFFFQRRYVELVLMGLISLIVVLSVYARQMTLEIIKVYIYNFTSITTDAGWWAMNAVFLLLLWFACYQIKCQKVSLEEFYALVLFGATFALGMLRAMLGLSPRKGFGDSFNRTFISYIPIVVYVVVIKVVFMMKSDLSKRKE